MSVRQAALELYSPPFRYERGYVWDSLNNMVSDNDTGGVQDAIAARIRGWGRIAYMDKPELRATALQDELGKMVAEALNDFWAKHQGGSNDSPI